MQNDTNNEDNDQEERGGEDSVDARMEEDDDEKDDDENNGDAHMSEQSVVREKESPPSKLSDAESTGDNAGVNPAPPGSHPSGASARPPPAKPVVGEND